MIERFNFYDIYGYLLPGLTFLGLMWLPFGLVIERWPPPELTSALAALVLGYIMGHILQGLATHVLPHVKKGRSPSDILLDKSDKTFSPEVKIHLENKIRESFHIDVSDANNKTLRQDAFFLCRRALIQKGTESYAEQFEGMYALMRGVTAASGLAAAYHLGWTLAGCGLLLPHFTAWSLRLTFVMLGLLVAIGFLELISPKKFSKASAVLAFWLLVILLFALGSLLGLEKVVSYEKSLLLFGVCLTSLFISLRCYTAYKRFANIFAETVYRDFCALELAPIGKDA